MLILIGPPVLKELLLSFIVQDRMHLNKIQSFRLHLGDTLSLGHLSTRFVVSMSELSKQINRTSRILIRYEAD